MSSTLARGNEQFFHDDLGEIVGYYREVDVGRYRFYVSTGVGKAEWVAQIDHWDGRWRLRWRLKWVSHGQDARNKYVGHNDGWRLWDVEFHNRLQWLCDHAVANIVNRLRWPTTYRAADVHQGGSDG